MNAIKGSKKAGIVPYVPDFFCEIDFVGAEGTEYDKGSTEHD